MAAVQEDVLWHLYGGAQPWSSEVWQTSDDRVRGGSSRSSLTVLNPERARFSGHLDTKTLGGAGFASQHSVGTLDLDLSAYDGILLSIVDADRSKRFALTLKDTLPVDRRPDGRQQAAISWEADFVPPSDADGDMSTAPAKVWLPWSAFKATYRGRDKPDAEPLNLKSIKRIGLMMRSFFDEQDGDFFLDLHFIAAQRSLPEVASANPEPSSEREQQDVEDEEDEEDDLRKDSVLPQQPARSTWRSLFCGFL